jgi:hypothetical protein
MDTLGGISCNFSEASRVEYGYDTHEGITGTYSIVAFEAE